jgi:SAM-dependent methyltransferase
MLCRGCNKELNHQFLDLGASPPSNAYLNEKTINLPEIFYPLRVLVCDACWLVQTEDFALPGDLFDKDYAYLSSTSSSWLEHCKEFANCMIKDLGLNSQSFVVEIAANDGYLLQNFKNADIPCLGVEPTQGTAEIAKRKGISIIQDFFTKNLAREMLTTKGAADLIIANNVLAHVPDINDFVAGIKELLKEDGIASFEFPHFLNLLQENQFDTVYHEHFSYLSVIAINNVFSSNGLKITRIEKLQTHGGSLRVIAQRQSCGDAKVDTSVQKFIDLEINAGLTSIDTYLKFQDKVIEVKNEFIKFLLTVYSENKKVIAYGAAAKGNTLINFAGIRPDLISFVVDRSEFKIGKWMPGSRIPILEEKWIDSIKPDYILILPWNIKKEVMSQLSSVREWGCKFVTAIPKIEVQ